MNHSFIYLIVLAIVIQIASFMSALSQDDNETMLNNENLDSKFLINSSLKNILLNSSDLSPLTNTTSDLNGQPLKVGSDDNATFIISGDLIVMPLNGTEIDVSHRFSGIQLPKRAVFIIDFVRPSSTESYENRSLKNGAYLSRKVEGTPHGYVTYFG
jgi:hypothetical protein